MSKVSYFALNTSFADVNTLQANGTIVQGANSPEGIAGHLTIEDGCMVATVNQFDAVTAHGRRSEITSFPDVPGLGEYWYTWLVKLEQLDWAHETRSFIVMQIHDSPDGGDQARAPNFLLTVANGQFVTLLPVPNPPTQGGEATQTGRYPVTFGKWHLCCLHADWQKTAIGFREFFIDGTPVGPRQWGIGTQYDDTVGPYAKIGVYNYKGYTDFGSKTARFKDLTVWSGMESYDIVMGTSPVPPANALVL